MTRPILYSFRRCPYAMRARLSIAASGLQVELREILLRDKAAAFLAASPKGTVPVVVNGDQVIEESLDVMEWALGQSDPENLLYAGSQARELILRCEAEFKGHLDRFKYAVRYEDVDPETERKLASTYLLELNQRLDGQAYLFGDRIGMADIGIAPFVRQFANTDRAWFDGQDWPDLIRWLDGFIDSDRFQSIMTKYPKWEEGDPVTLFPAPPPE
ncbi:glutathione S-transferase [Neptunicoccus sediminis]|uniref:glutathione S-transferase n=1 Tax=Neptunicoccus sediminis TaxID=1892596 RepID=UPI0009F31949|nr:glutathione S-transferase [Neptunicoccus sediminis]